MRDKREDSSAPGTGERTFTPAPGSRMPWSPAPLHRLEWLTLAHAAILLVGTTWAFGGQSDDAQTAITWWGSLGILVTLAALQDREAWREGWMRPLVWLGPLAAFNVFVLLGCINPSFREVKYEGEILLINQGGFAGFPSSARPLLGLRALWLFDALWISCFNLALVLRQRRAIRMLLLVVGANAAILAVFGTVQKLAHAKGIFFDLVPTKQNYFFASFVYHNHWGGFMLLMLTAGLGLTWPDSSPDRYHSAFLMSRHRTIALALLALDAVATVLVFNLIAFLRGLPFHEGLMLLPLSAPVAATVFAIYLIEGYKARTDMISVEYTSQHSIALTSVMLGVLLLTYAFITTNYELQSSRAVIMLSFLALVPVTLAYRRTLYLRTLKTRGEHSLVFLGDRASRVQFQTECRKMGVTQRVIYGAAASESAVPFGADAADKPRPFEEILDEAQQGRLGVEAIVLRETARELQPDVSRRLVQLYFAGVPTYTLELFHQVYWRKIPIYRLNQTWLFQDGFQIAREPAFERLKRSSDIVLSLLGLVLSAPLVALGGLAIWLEDRGPVFFAQTRVGKNHVPFRIFKLRTMRPTSGDAPYTAEGDIRITRIGRLLRTTRIDEFPQMWNVLIGDMSLIGPRVEWDRLVEGYEREIPCYHFRHLVKPGITGWAQVNYPYGANLEDTVRKLEYDLYYIRHFSFRLDASIVLKTIHIILFGKGR